VAFEGEADIRGSFWSQSRPLIHLSGVVSVELENVGAEIDLALRFTKRPPHLQRNRLCELVALLMHDDSGFVDDCLDLRRELQTSVVSAGPMSSGENFVLLLYQTSDRIWCCCGLYECGLLRR
jgi:hypothetical protein